MTFDKHNIKICILSWKGLSVVLCCSMIKSKCASVHKYLSHNCKVSLKLN